jgi:hypothetical protein
VCGQSDIRLLIDVGDALILYNFDVFSWSNRSYTDVLVPGELGNKISFFVFGLQVERQI